MIVLKVAPITPASRQSDMSRTICRFGWSVTGACRTINRSKGRLRKAIGANAPNMMAPSITGGNVSIHGQTCPP